MPRCARKHSGGSIADSNLEVLQENLAIEVVVNPVFRRPEGLASLNMHKQKGFSLLELLIAVGIILIIAAIAIPNLMRARMASNEASAVESLRTINSALISYNIGWPAQGYATTLSVLGSTPCHPNATTPCLIDGVLAGGTKSGYLFAESSSGGTPTTKYFATAIPITVNQTGINSYCTSEDGVIRMDPTGAVAGSESACQGLTPLGATGGSGSGGSGSSGGSGGSGSGSGGSGGGNGNGNNGNGNGNGGGSGSGSNGNGNGNGGTGNGNGGGNGNGNNGNGNGNGGGNGSGNN